LMLRLPILVIRGGLHTTLPQKIIERRVAYLQKYMMTKEVLHMSKERELLKKIWEDLDGDRDNYNSLCEEIEELFAQPEQEPLSPIEKHEIFLMSLIENNGEGLKELKAFDIETYNKLKEVFGNES